MKFRTTLATFFIATVASFAANAQALIFGIQEGTGSSGESQYAAEKYRSFGEELGRLLKREVKVVGLSPANQFDIEKTKSIDILLARPSAVAGWAVDKLGFVPLASINDVRSLYVYSAGSKQIKSLADLKGASIAISPSQTETYRYFAMAAQKAGLGISDFNIHAVKLQPVIVFALENQLAEYGVVSDDSSSVGALRDAKMKAVYKIGELPPWAIVANARLGEDTLDKLKIALTAFSGSAERKLILQNLKIAKISAPVDGLYSQTFRALFPEMAR